MKEQAGFTLIEILVVISIIAFLAMSAIVLLKSSKEKSKTVKCKAELQQISKAIELKREEKNNYIGSITGYCSGCACHVNGNGGLALDPGRMSDPSNPNYLACQNAMSATFNQLGFGGLKDPWGYTYIIDENENEFLGNPCLFDIVQSYNCGYLNVPFYVCK